MKYRWSMARRRQVLEFLSSRLMPVAKRIFTPLALAALLYFAWRSRDILSQIVAGADPHWILVSITIWIGLHLVSPIVTTHIFRSRELSIGYTTALRIHAGRLPAKYLPGGVWHSVARARDYYDEGIATGAVGWYLLIENVVIASVTLALGGVLVAVQESLAPAWRAAGFVSFLTGVAAILIVPVISRWGRWWLAPLAAPGEYVKCVLYMSGYWLMVGMAFASYLRSFDTLELTGSAVAIAGIYIFSWAIGFITLIAPQGIGVSELISSQLLESSLAATGFMALIAGFRIVILVADVLAWGASFVLANRAPD